MLEHVPSNCFIINVFGAAVSVLVGPCCPALLNCIDVGVHTVVLLGKINETLTMIQLGHGAVVLYILQAVRYRAVGVTAIEVRPGSGAPAARGVFRRYRHSSRGSVACVSGV